MGTPSAYFDSHLDKKAMKLRYSYFVHPIPALFHLNFDEDFYKVLDNSSEDFVEWEFGNLLDFEIDSYLAFQLA